MVGALPAARHERGAPVLAAHLPLLGAGDLRALAGVLVVQRHGHVGGAAVVALAALLGDEVVEEARGGALARGQQAQRRGGRGGGAARGRRGGRLAVRRAELLVQHHLRVGREGGDLNAFDTFHFAFRHPFVLDPEMFHYFILL